MKQMLKAKPKLDKYRPDVGDIIGHSKKKHLFKQIGITPGGEIPGANASRERPSMLAKDLKGSRRGAERTTYSRVKKYNTSKWLEDVDEEAVDQFIQ
jgi:hypothetical protein